MQQIERYGVIALVFFLVTIVAVSFWGDSKSPGFWSRLTGRGHKDATADQITPASSSTDGALTPPAPLDLDPNRALMADNGTAVPPPAGAPANLQVAVNESPVAPGAGVTPPASAPAPAPAPAVATNEYVVQKGDSLALIARRTLGKESRWTEIAALNPGLTPKNLKVGAKLALPGDAAPIVAQPATPAPKKASPAAKPKSGAESGRTCKVLKGDTLKAIARRELGDGDRWKEIVDLNPGLSPSKLAVGQVLLLPRGTRAVEQPSATLVANAAPASNKPQIR